MGCLLALMSAFAPRLVFLIIWIARPTYVDAVFETWIFPLLGLLFLPFTTLMWVLLDAPPVGVHGFDWFWLVIAVFLDLGHYGSAYANRGQMPGRTSTA
ncbi:MAG: hypothetical protein ACRDHU_11550 [Actinomycetota bacterium]